MKRQVVIIDTAPATEYNKDIKKLLFEEWLITMMTPVMGYRVISGKENNAVQETSAIIYVLEKEDKD